MTDSGSGTQSPRSVAIALFALGVVDLLVLNGVLVPRYVDELEGGPSIAFSAPIIVDNSRSEGFPRSPVAEGDPPDEVSSADSSQPLLTAPPEEELAPAPESAPGEGEADTAEAAPAPAQRAGEGTGDSLPSEGRDLEDVAPILFAEGSAVLDHEAKRRLWTVVWILRREPEARVLLRGHSDEGGEASSGPELGRSRAAAAASFLVEQGRVEGERVGSEGASASSSETTHEQDAAARRRAEVVWQ